LNRYGTRAFAARVDFFKRHLQLQLRWRASLKVTQMKEHICGGVRAADESKGPLGVPPGDVASFFHEQGRCKEGDKVDSR
jgi:hypothetical protein